MSFESSILPRNAEHLHTVIPNEVLGLALPEAPGVDYASTPLDIYRSPQQDGSERFDAITQSAPLAGQELFSFLRLVAPADFGNLKGVIDDWKVVDQAHRSNVGGFAKARAQELVELHRHLGKSWMEFLKSREVLLDVLVDGQEVDAIHTTRRVQRLVDESTMTIGAGHIAYHTARARRELTKVLERGFEASGAADPQGNVLDMMTGAVNSVRHGKRPITNTHKIRTYFASMPNEQRERAILRLLRSMDEADQTSFIKGAKSELYEALTAESGAIYLFPRQYLKRPIADSIAAGKTGKIVVGRYQADTVLIYPREEGDAKPDVLMLPESIIELEPAKTVSPLLTWRRDSEGNRDFVIRRARDNRNFGRFADGVLGVLLSAYLSPEIRENWPSELPIRDSRKQYIGAAQVPVLALMRQKQLLRSDVFEALETANIPVSV